MHGRTGLESPVRGSILAKQILQGPWSPSRFRADLLALQKKRAPRVVETVGNHLRT